LIKPKSPSNKIDYNGGQYRPRHNHSHGKIVRPNHYSIGRIGANGSNNQSHGRIQINRNYVTPSNTNNNNNVRIRRISNNSRYNGRSSNGSVTVIRHSVHNNSNGNRLQSRDGARVIRVDRSSGKVVKPYQIHGGQRNPSYTRKIVNPGGVHRPSSKNYNPTNYYHHPDTRVNQQTYKPHKFGNDNIHHHQGRTHKIKFNPFSNVTNNTRVLPQNPFQPKNLNIQQRTNNISRKGPMGYYQSSNSKRLDNLTKNNIQRQMMIHGNQNTPQIRGTVSGQVYSNSRQPQNLPMQRRYPGNRMF
jgi:hypothetical protein